MKQQSLGESLKEQLNRDETVILNSLESDHEILSRPKLKSESSKRHLEDFDNLTRAVLDLTKTADYTYPDSSKLVTSLGSVNDDLFSHIVRRFDMQINSAFDVDLFSEYWDAVRLHRILDRHSNDSIIENPIISHHRKMVDKLNNHFELAKNLTIDYLAVKEHIVELKTLATEIYNN